MTTAAKRLGLVAFLIAVALASSILRSSRVGAPAKERISDASEVGDGSKLCVPVSASTGGFLGETRLPVLSGNRPVASDRAGAALQTPPMTERICGWVYNADGSTPKAAWVYTATKYEDERGGIRTYESSAETDEEGRFCIIGIISGETAIRAYSRMGHCETRLGAVAKNQSRSVILFLEEYPRFSGTTVLDDSGVGKNACLIVVPKNATSTETSLSSDELGRFSFFLETAGQARILARCRDDKGRLFVGTEDIASYLPRDDIVLHLCPSGSIVVRVHGAPEDVPLEDGHLLWIPEDSSHYSIRGQLDSPTTAGTLPIDLEDQSESFWKWRVMESGYLLEGLFEGPYHVVVFLGSLVGYTKGFVCYDGIEERDVFLEPFARLQLFVDASGTQPPNVSVSRSDGLVFRLGEGRPEAGGSWLFVTALPAGIYRVLIEGMSSLPTVPEFNLRAGERDTIRVRRN